MDDICPQMNMDKFLEYKSLFDEFDIKPLIGIIPDNQDVSIKFDNDFTNFWGMMRQLQEDGWAIAQHGYQHIYCSQVPGILSRRKLSEFAGLTYEDQFEKIRKGKRILEQNGLYTDIFMAPGHSFDITTLRVLKECGFKYITDGLSSLPYMYCGLKFIPCRHLSPLTLPGINTWCIHSNTWTKIYFNRIKKAVQQKNALSFRDILNVSCFNTDLCQREEKFYELSHMYIIAPPILLKKRISNWIRRIKALNN